MDANVLQQHKENITPLPVGRSASKLAKALGESRSRTSLSAQRDLLEAKLLSDELDDPLQEYVNYIEWIHNHYPQGANAESGLLTVLERCTSFFRDADHYKNDPRYLKVWLEYAAYSDSPRDVFVYLAKKRIGCELALYYEEFARFLEVRHAYNDAKDVYEVGISRNARPLARLQRSLAAFSKRTEAHFTESTREVANSGLRQILSKRAADKDATEANSEVHGISGRLGGSLKKRVTVYGDPAPVSIKDEVFRSDDNAVLTSLRAAKENKIAAKPWNGEVLKQKLVSERSSAKFSVFKDAPEEGDLSVSTSGYELVQENGQHYTVIRHPGKAPERLAVNLNLLYRGEEETCLTELLGLITRREEQREQEREQQRGGLGGGEKRPFESRSSESRSSESRSSENRNPQLIENRNPQLTENRNPRLSTENRNSWSSTENRNPHLTENRNSHLTENRNSHLTQNRNSHLTQNTNSHLTQNTNSHLTENRASKLITNALPIQESEQTHTFTIPLRDGNTTQTAKSPTMTLFSRLTTNEVLGMFNDAALNFQSDDESTKANEESTNYDGFVTETIHGAETDHVTTPPTDHYDSGSSPFLDRP